jgi:hypothetical protein
MLRFPLMTQSGHEARHPIDNLDCASAALVIAALFRMTLRCGKGVAALALTMFWSRVSTA